MMRRGVLKIGSSIIPVKLDEKGGISAFNHFENTRIEPVERLFSDPENHYRLQRFLSSGKMDDFKHVELA